jgi:hypothetical protein
VLLRYALGLFNCGVVGFNELYQAMGKGIRFTRTAPDSAPDLELLYAQGRRVSGMDLILCQSSSSTVIASL